jgi:hypothetical protein
METTVVSAFAAGCGDDAAALVFEYMAATQAETGQAVPGGIGELPAVLQRECRDLPAVLLPGRGAGCLYGDRPGNRGYGPTPLSQEANVPPGNCVTSWSCHSSLVRP